jgi:hypothetical protein
LFFFEGNHPCFSRGKQEKRKSFFVKSRTNIQPSIKTKGLDNMNVVVTFCVIVASCGFGLWGLGFLKFWYQLRKTESFLNLVWAYGNLTRYFIVKQFQPILHAVNNRRYDRWMKQIEYTWSLDVVGSYKNSRGQFGYVQRTLTAHGNEKCPATLKEILQRVEKTTEIRTWTDIYVLFHPKPFSLAIACYRIPVAENGPEKDHKEEVKETKELSPSFPPLPWRHYFDASVPSLEISSLRCCHCECNTLHFNEDAYVSRFKTQLTFILRGVVMAHNGPPKHLSDQLPFLAGISVNSQGQFTGHVPYSLFERCPHPNIRAQKEEDTTKLSASELRRRMRAAATATTTTTDTNLAFTWNEGTCYLPLTLLWN